MIEEVGYTVDYKKDNASDRSGWVHSGLQKGQRDTDVGMMGFSVAKKKMMMMMMVMMMVVICQLICGAPLSTRFPNM